jgi:hypothetical protein
MGDNRDLQSILTKLVHRASEAVSNPIRASSENLCGYIETVWAERPGIIWLTGWISRAAAQEFAVVLADRRKHAGAVAMACYDRDDLPAGAHAFVAMLQTAWQPDQETQDVFLFFGAELKHFIRTVSPIKFQDGRSFAAEFARVQPFCHAGRVNALRLALLGGQSWLPHTAALSGSTAKCGVDEVLVLPGFGCFIQGWMVSPAKRLDRVSLKLADQVLNDVPGSLYFLPRPDLASVAPHVPGLLDSAGFIAALTGPLQSEDLVSPILKAWFSDGTSVNFPIDSFAVRRLGHAVPYEEILRLFPGIAGESFFGDCARAISSEVLDRLSDVRPLDRFERCERYLVAALPPGASDARLMVDQIELHLRQAPANLGIALLCNRGATRATLPMLIDAIRSSTGAPCAAFLVEDTGKPLLALARLLELVQAGRFFYLGSGMFPDATGWKACLDTLFGEGQELSFMTTEEGRLLAGMSWTTKSLMALLRRTPAAIGSRHNQVLPDPAAAPVGTVHAIAPGGRMDRLLEKIDLSRPVKEAV